MRWLAHAVRYNMPLQYKFEFGLWTLSRIRALIKRQFGKELSIATVSRLMKVLGFSAQKPLYQAWQQDGALVRKWEAENLSVDSRRSTCGGREDLLRRRVGNPFRLSHRHDVNAAWPDAGRCHRPVLLAEHDLGGEPAGRVPLVRGPHKAARHARKLTSSGEWPLTGA